MACDMAKGKMAAWLMALVISGIIKHGVAKIISGGHIAQTAAAISRILWHLLTKRISAAAWHRGSGNETKIARSLPHNRAISRMAHQRVGAAYRASCIRHIIAAYRAAVCITADNRAVPRASVARISLNVLLRALLSYAPTGIASHQAA